MLDFSSLKKNSSLTGSNLVQKIEEQSSSFKEDERFWNCQRDKSGNGMAVIRFLPAPKGEDIPWVKYFRHSFQGPTGKWYIENSLTSINLVDPVGELNAKLWNTGFDSDKEVARKQRRNTCYVSNIYIIKDPENPENEGKVFLFRYGKKIFDKIRLSLQPEFEDETPCDPFCFWEGANFKLKVRKVDGQVNYDSSVFESPSALLDDDKALEAIWSKEHSLIDFLDPKNYKSYEELQKRLDLVLNQKPTKDESQSDDVAEENVAEAKSSKKSSLEKPEIKEEKKAEPKPTPKYGESDDDDDDIPDYFAGLAKK